MKRGVLQRLSDSDVIALTSCEGCEARTGSDCVYKTTAYARQQLNRPGMPMKTVHPERRRAAYDELVRIALELVRSGLSDRPDVIRAGETYRPVVYATAGTAVRQAELRWERKEQTQLRDWLQQHAVSVLIEPREDSGTDG